MRSYNFPELQRLGEPRHASAGGHSSMPSHLSTGPSTCTYTGEGQRRAAGETQTRANGKLVSNVRTANM